MPILSSRTSEPHQHVTCSTFINLYCTSCPHVIIYSHFFFLCIMNLHPPETVWRRARFKASIDEKILYPVSVNYFHLHCWFHYYQLFIFVLSADFHIISSYYCKNIFLTTIICYNCRLDPHMAGSPFFIILL